MALEKVGALWLKDGKKGKFMSGEVNGVRVLVFKNSHHEPGDKKPDYEVYVSADEEREAAPTQTPREEFRASDDDVPF